MKKCIISALSGALAMLIAITVMAWIYGERGCGAEEYEHIDYVSNIASDDCYVCGNTGNNAASAYWGEDNVGIINLNNFDLLHLPINRYVDHGELAEALKQTAKPGDIMLFKGSRGMHMEIALDLFLK